MGGDFQRGGAERAEEAEKRKRGEDFNTENTESTEKKEEGTKKERKETFYLEEEEGEQRDWGVVGRIRMLVSVFSFSLFSALCALWSLCFNSCWAWFCAGGWWRDERTYEFGVGGAGAGATGDGEVSLVSDLV